MEKLHLVMPMAGGGTRFSGLYGVPKPLIELRNKPFFYWAAQSVLQHTEVSGVTFAVLKEHVEKFRIDREILKYYPSAEIITIPEVLNGAVLTCMRAIEGVRETSPVLFNDCDHAFLCSSFYEYCRIAEFDRLDGALLTFRSQSPNYSYVRFDDQGDVTGTVEKEVVSEDAICGAYYFRNRNLFMEYADRYLEACSYKEYFMSGVYNEMLKDKRTVTTFKTDLHISFGTPEELETAAGNEDLGEIIQ